MLATSELQYKLCLKIISEARLARSAQRLLQLWMTVIYGQNIRDWKEILLSFTLAACFLKHLQLIRSSYSS